MRAPTLGSVVQVIDPATKKLIDGDDREWMVWSQSPTGWHLFRRDQGGGLR